MEKEKPLANCKTLQFISTSKILIHPHGSKDHLMPNDEARLAMLNYGGIIGDCYLIGGCECYFFDEHNNRLSLEQAKQKLLKELDQEITEALNNLIKLNPYE